MTALRALPEADKSRRGVLYLRQSTEKEETISDAIQRTAGMDYCARNGIELVSIRDAKFPSLEEGELWEQHTGRVWDKRTGVQRAMALVESGDVDVIVVWKWSRLSRNRLHWATAEAQVEKLGGAIESATEPADLTTSSGRFSRNVLVDMAEMQSDQIGEGWKETHANRRARGLPATGGKRFGYHWHRGSDEHYTINHDLTDAVRWAYAEYIAGRGHATIAREFNRHSITNAHDRTWNTRALHDWMDSGFAAGLLSRIPFRNNKVVNVPFGQRHWDEGAHEAIIDPDTWQAYCAARRTRTTPPRNATPVQPFAGLIKCEDCGAAMHRKNGGRAYYQFVCGQYRRAGSERYVAIDERRVHTAVKDWLAQITEDIDTEAERIELGKRATLRNRTDADTAAREVRELDRQLAELTRQLTQGVVPQGTYITVKEQIEDDRAAAQARLDSAEVESQRQHRPPREVAVALLRDWEVLAVERIRAMLGELITRIAIRPGEQGQLAQVVLETTWDEHCVL